jgi:hypothetical protein
MVMETVLFPPSAPEKGPEQAHSAKTQLPPKAKTYFSLGPP